MTAAADSPDVGEVVADRYELRELLGEGGMSCVFLARDRDLDRDVAVKLLRGPGDADDLGRLRDEARAAAAVEHPGVVTVHDVGAVAGGLYVVMSYLDGESLAQRLDRDGPLPAATVVAVGRAVCDALGAAHRAGVVHRDVSPGNIVLRPDGAVTVTDFGIARIGEGAGRTVTGYIVGTPAYLAPEQARGDARLDGRADLYSLGCCLFAALTGRPPFADPDPMTVALAHIRRAPPRPSALQADVPPAVERVVMTALAKDPARRYRDAAAMGAALADAARADALPGGPAPGGTPADAPRRTQVLPEGHTREMPAGHVPMTEPLHRAVADAEDAEGAAADRRRTAGIVLLVLAALLAVGVVVGVVLLG